MYILYSDEYFILKLSPFFLARCSREIAAFDLWGMDSLPPLFSRIFHTIRSLALIRSFYPSVSVSLARTFLKSGIKTFLTFHTCFMGISRLGRKICKLNGINEKKEPPFFNFISVRSMKKTHCIILIIKNFLSKIIGNNILYETKEKYWNFYIILKIIQFL